LTAPIAGIQIAMAHSQDIAGSEPSSRLHKNRPLASSVDVAKVVLGIWLFISGAALAPHQTSRSFVHSGLVNGMVVGGLLMLTGIYAAMRASSTQQLTRTHRRHYWSVSTFALSAWLVASPWIVGFDDSSRLLWNAVVSGIVLFALSSINLLLTRKHLGREQHPGFIE
jgi:hypothetical protein